MAAAAEVKLDARPKAFRLPPPDPEGLQRILNGAERPLIDAHARDRLLRLLQLWGEGHVTLLVTTIVESAGNEGALIEPIISAVNDIMHRRPEWPERGGQWLEAFDDLPLLGLLEVFRGLDAFTDRELSHHYMISLGRRLRKWFDAEYGVQPRPEPTRTSKARRAIEQGLELLKLKGPHATSPITRLAHERFRLGATECGQVIAAAKLYGDKIWLVEKMSQDALFELVRPSTPPALREAIERRLRAGEKVKGAEIRRLRTMDRRNPDNLLPVQGC